MPAQLDGNKETRGFLPGLWACFSRKFVYYRYSGMPLPALKNNIGVQVDRNCPTLSRVYLEMNKRYKIEGIHLLSIYCLKSILKQLPNNFLKQNSAQLNTDWRGCNPQPRMPMDRNSPRQKKH